MLVKVRLLNGAEQWIGYNVDEVREIFRLIDWMMSLPEDLSGKFEEELVALEELTCAHGWTRMSLPRPIESPAYEAREKGPRWMA